MTQRRLEAAGIGARLPEVSAQSALQLGHTRREDLTLAGESERNLESTRGSPGYSGASVTHCYVQHPMAWRNALSGIHSVKPSAEILQPLIGFNRAGRAVFTRLDSHCR